MALSQIILTTLVLNVSSPKIIVNPYVISIVNFTNQIEYVPDSVNYGMTEYYATIEETLERMSGDCDDIAQLVYGKLKEIGFQPFYLILRNRSEEYLSNPLLNSSTYSGEGHVAVAFKEDGLWSAIEQGVLRQGYKTERDLAKAFGYDSYRLCETLEDIPAALFPVD